MCRVPKRRVWDYWAAGVLTSFAVLEYPAFRYDCHETLSHVLHDRRLGPAILAGGVVLAVHVMRYQYKSNDLPNPALSFSKE